MICISLVSVSMSVRQCKMRPYEIVDARPYLPDSFVGNKSHNKKGMQPTKSRHLFANRIILGRCDSLVVVVGKGLF